MPVLYFYGEDTYAAREAIGVLAEKEEVRVRWVDKEELTGQGAGQVVAQGGGGLFGKEMVVVRDPSELAKGAQEELARALQAAGSGLFVLWDRVEPKKNQVVCKEYARQGRRFAVPEVRDLCGWLVKLAKDRQVELDYRVAQLLVDRVGLSRWELAAELEKLALVKKEIGEREVSEAVPASAQAEVFAVLDALARGAKERVVAGINNLLAQGNGEFYILSMLAYQFKTLLVVRRGIDQGKKQFEIVRESGLKQYSVQKNWEAARRRPAEFWRAALTRVLATDYAIRQGKVDARTGVLMLVAGLV